MDKSIEFVLEELKKIKKGEKTYYESPIMTKEEWREKYPHESDAEIPDYIPSWRDLDEIIYRHLKEKDTCH